MLYNHKNYFLGLPVILALLLSGCTGQPQEKTAVSNFQTGVIAQSHSDHADENWGQFYSYFQGETHYTQENLTGVAIIKAGEQIHPPHEHAEEEFLMVIEGEGTWTIGTTDMPAKAGDIMYSAPWDLHGIRNTGTTPLKFVVFKFNPKNTTAKPKPK